MEFARQLQRLLDEQEGAQSVAGNELSDWNDQVEGFLFASPAEQKRKFEEGKSSENEESMEISKQELDSIARVLKETIVVLFSNSLGISGEDDIAVQERMKFIMDRLKGQGENATITDRANKDWIRLESLCRTSSNFFRWYLQVFLQHTPLVHPMSSSPFQASTMLSIIIFLVEYNAKIVDVDIDVDAGSDLSPSQRFARYASLLLFYTTFSPRSPNDAEMQKTHERLVTDVNIIPRVLKLLTYQSTTSAALALSLIRNVHNLLASYPGAIKAVQQTGLPYDEATTKAPWSPKKDDNTDGLITYPSIFRDVLIWSLNAPGLPPFPGPKEDRRPDLVIEILGIIFAMGGTEIARALRYPSPNAALSQLVITALQKLDSKDPRTHQVKLSTITILADASPSFGTFLVEKQAVKSLLEITEQQIDAVLKNTQVDEAAVSALIPSLAVLYKLSAGNPTFREATKTNVFPPSQEDQFWSLAQEQLTDTATAIQSNNGNVSNRVPPAKNMHPLDAPQSTLRFKLIRLMTWTESHIKRYASELLWALCDEDPKEFILRTGLGNAMAFLGAKGMVQLPAHALQ